MFIIVKLKYLYVLLSLLCVLFIIIIITSPNFPKPYIVLCNKTYLYLQLTIFKILINKSFIFSGDITQKGYEKKKTRLLAPYAPKQPLQGL